MATVINNPPGNSEGGGAAGVVITGIVVIILVVLFFVYGLPRIRSGSDTQINVPDSIDINTNGSGQ